MGTITPDELEIFPLIKGANQYSKVSYPLRYGHYSKIRTSEYIYQFNLNGEIKFITGRHCDWPDPSEWLKRTITNDWLYYSTGGYSGTMEYSGEYYVPCAQYSTNSILINSPFDNESVTSAVKSYDRIYETINGLKADEFDTEARLFLDKIKSKSPENLKNSSLKLKKILGDRITVLPPDTRHVDYEVIPIVIADGCLYKCGFCALKSSKNFSLRSEKNIQEQIHSLKHFYGEDITVPDAERSYSRMTEINKKFEYIELTANFLYSENLPENHYSSIFRLIDKNISTNQWKGAAYFSPLLGSDRKEIRGTKRKFYDIKRRLSVPCFLYLIQRL